jgi:hypothetical protein
VNIIFCFRIRVRDLGGEGRREEGEMRKEELESNHKHLH